MERIPIHNPFPGAECFLVPVTDSTMDEGRRLSAAGFPVGTVVAADRQTSGRGRFRERSWISEPGRDLTFTVILPLRAALLPGLPLRAGLALLRAAEAYAGRLGRVPREGLSIKWPNDLLANGRKLAGILCESSAERCYVGIGVNCGKPAAAGFRTEASGLAEEIGAEVERFRLLELFLERLASALEERDWQAEAAKRLWLRGERVLFRTGLSDPGAPGTRTVEGTLHSIGASGELILKTAGGLEAFVSGELARPWGPVGAPASFTLRD